MPSVSYPLPIVDGSALPCSGHQPRRWSHLPLDANFLGLAYAYTNGDIFLKPVLQIKDGKFDLNTYALKYIRSFELFEKSARFDITQSYQSGE